MYSPRYFGSSGFRVISFIGKIPARADGGGTTSNGKYGFVLVCDNAVFILALERSTALNCLNDKTTCWLKP